MDNIQNTHLKHAKCLILRYAPNPTQKHKHTHTPKHNSAFYFG